METQIDVTHRKTLNPRNSHYRAFAMQNPTQHPAQPIVLDLTQSDEYNLQPYTNQTENQNTQPKQVSGPSAVSGNLCQISRGIFKVKKTPKSSQPKIHSDIASMNDLFSTTTQPTPAPLNPENSDYLEQFSFPTDLFPDTLSPSWYSLQFSPGLLDSPLMNQPSPQLAQAPSPLTHIPSPTLTIPVVSTGDGRWLYTTQGQDTYFPSELNSKIEHQYKLGKPHVSFELYHFNNYTLFFDSMVMQESNNPEQIPVRRVVQSSSVIQIPVNQFNTDQSLKIKYPIEWETQSHICELKEVSPATMEFQRIQQLCSTVSTKIVSIKRIQNQHLWRRYYLERSFVEQKNGGNPNEMELFHGTRSTRPVEIYNGEEGFDMRYSKKGLWGMGIYFASEANYSYRFSYVDSETNCKQMLFSRVAIGSAFSCLSGDATLRTPPAKTKDHVSQSRIPFATDFYDSVVGIIGNSKIYTVYSNSKAYPSYLISFEN